MKHIPHLGFMGNLDASSARIAAFTSGLRDLGYVEGHTVVIEWRFSVASNARFAALAAEFVYWPVDLIVAGNAWAAMAASKATSTIPIVLAAVNDPVGLGIIASLDRPGGNVTGTTIFAPQLIGQRLQILRELVPELLRVAMLANGANPNNPAQFRELEIAGDAIGVDVKLLDVRSRDELDRAFATASDWGADGLLNGVDSVINSLRTQIAALAAQWHLAAVYSDREYVGAGGLMSYGPGHLEGYRRAASFVDRILRGAQPADLPVEQPTTFEIVVSRRALEGIGRVIPPIITPRVTQWVN